MAFTIPFKEMVELTEIFFDSDWLATGSTPFEIGRNIKVRAKKINKDNTLNYSEKFYKLLLMARIFLKKSAMLRSSILQRGV